jgi:hypothetical protein
MRMKDALGSTVLEESYGLKYAEWAWGPHVITFNCILYILLIILYEFPRICTIKDGEDYKVIFKIYIINI